MKSGVFRPAFHTSALGTTLASLKNPEPEKRELARTRLRRYLKIVEPVLIKRLFLFCLFFQCNHILFLLLVG